MKCNKLNWEVQGDYLFKREVKLLELRTSVNNRSK